MKSIVVYGSKYGTSKRYGEKCAEQLGCKVISYDDEVALHEYERIIYFGGLYAGKVFGLDAFIKRISQTAKIVLVTVGLANGEKEKTLENIRHDVSKQISKDLFDRVTLFHLRGAIDYSLLNEEDKLMMSVMNRVLKSKPKEELSEDNIKIIETYNEKLDFVDFDKLNSIVEQLKEK